MEFDVVIVGAGPSGLAAACQIKKQAAEAEQEISVCVVEKGSEVGAHILSGAVFEPRALEELFPDWKEMGAPLNTEVKRDDIYMLTSADKSTKLPDAIVPKTMHNHGNYIISLGNLCRWLAEQAEGLGVEVYPGFAAQEALIDENGVVRGILTGDLGVDREGNPKDGFYTPGMELRAKYTLFAEGARGSLTKQLKAKFDLEKDCQPQTYGLGIKELWEIDPKKHVPGRVIHTQGWPLDNDSWGGGFLYHIGDNQVALGFVTALDYANPYLSPYHEFQRWKHHPDILDIIEGGKRVAYGARVINEGGWQSVPQLAFPGGALIGCSAGFVNVPRIKGSHTAMKSGMLAAESVASAIAAGKEHTQLDDYEENLRESWIATELKKVKNAQPAIAKLGGDFGTVLAGIDMWMRTLKIGLPITMKHHRDHEMLQRADLHQKIAYPKPDGKLSFDKLTNVAFSYTNHAEDQPVHLKVCDWELQKTSELGEYDGPSNRYCPAGVYEWLAGEDTGEMKFQINSQNCIHCKTCDIKDPNQNIEWTTPEGGGGPNYPNM